ncbi:hypothetical protein [Defluviimonas salinarum]|uniref:Uncharacterized protein n=1 Tax=Defluviimonas salinarum TaxID=2992147 RepID=A0ABT3J949_9RHOB|nr:hypothetical protein [Defluviimonas salinarum]MCW3784208.1 hypothetical protein [Defluviimonas salinarum]
MARDRRSHAETQLAPHAPVSIALATTRGANEDRAAYHAFLRTLARAAARADHEAIEDAARD